MLKEKDMQRMLKRNERETATHLRLTRPPRLKNAVHKKGVKPRKKSRKVKVQKPVERKPQSYTAKQRKDYQLRSKRH